MAKIKSDNFASALKRATADTRLFLFYGPDESGSAALAEKTRLHIGADAEKVELSGPQLKEDPALLAQEAASLSLFGDARVILVRGQGEECFAAIDALLEAETVANPCIAQISGITDRSRTAKLAGGDDRALACISYVPDVHNVAATIREMAEARGLAMPREIAETIARYTRLDRRLAEMEVEKIALYLDAQPGQRASVDMLVMEQLAAETEDDALAPAIQTILSGRTAQLAAELDRLSDGTLQPVLLIRALEARCVQLAKVHRLMADGKDAKSAMRSTGIFWKEEGATQHQLRCWPPAALERLAERLLTIHAKVMQNSQDAVRLLVQECTMIAMAAARKR
ncbi:DNA polymerase III subunit delta [Alterisphingorhabdus coralli]|uniref:DNA-directed DNA polymerase n=1 Tax=Alterisphingorhabdus coralli TaxID=3071408 RepID=A0AA97F6E7_9SPHN|nr:DNA polymerase III subunit delta [Parasphingorhabdus sp. SCSIO 66989]WOE75056.1 DNA polymerase III subunit delta [Parasphingorhabdus sp. SCSIO 66989]